MQCWIGSSEFRCFKPPGELPLLSSESKLIKDSVEQGTLEMSWPMTLLPALDATAVLKHIKMNAVPKSDQPSGSNLTLADTEKIWMPVFTCPDDVDSFKKPGGLSFVMNTGFIRRDLFHGDPQGLHHLGLISWDGNATLDEKVDVEVSAATGVIWRHNDAINPSLDYISTGDGTSWTIMVTENLQAGLWFDTDTAKISFGLPVVAPNGQVPFGPGASFESVERPLNADFTGGILTTGVPKDWRVNAELMAKIGTRARPSSNHVGGVNVIMCDGSGRFISEKIDSHVYIKLLTSNGVTYGEKEPKPNSF